jgi:hypothetical protein
MRNLKAIAMSAVLVAAMTGGAFALDQAGKANTMDPGSAPKAENQKPMKRTTGSAVNDAAAKANTTDPNSAPRSKEGMAKGGTKKLDAAGRANTMDPNSAPK